MNEIVRTRKAQRIERCKKMGINLEGLDKGVPRDDDELIVTALAASLGYDPVDVFDNGKTINDLEEDRAAISVEQQRIGEAAKKFLA